MASGWPNGHLHGLDPGLGTSTTDRPITHRAGLWLAGLPADIYRCRGSGPPARRLAPTLPTCVWWWGHARHLGAEEDAERNFPGEAISEPSMADSAL
jgi:hypothetical protein